MKIRQVKLSDLATIFQIETDNFSEAEVAGYDAIKLRITETPDTFLVAEIDGEVAGYIEGPVIGSKHLTDSIFESPVLTLTCCLPPDHAPRYHTVYCLFSA